MTNKKIGFWPVVAIVVGSQIGSGVFMLPSSLAQFGIPGLYSWIVSGLGSVFLALTFGFLCEKFPRTGGPHIYVEETFGKLLGFLAAWGYFIASWMTVPGLTIGVVSNLVNALPVKDTSTINLSLELAVLWITVGINMLGVRTAGILEFIYTILKIIPLVLLPLFAVHLVDYNYSFSGFELKYPTGEAFTKASVLIMWGFLGLEAATTPAGSIENPSKTIPRALVVGTIAVALIYLFGTFVIMGAMPINELAVSASPYADLTRTLLGDGWDKIISIVIAIVCLGTLHACILTSGQISLGAAQDGLFPRIFGKLNRKAAPSFGLMIPAVFVSGIFFLLQNSTLNEQFSLIIEMTTTGYIIIYLACALALVKFLKNAKNVDGKLFRQIIAGISVIFSFWILMNVEIFTITSFLGMLALTLPIYWYRKKSGMIASKALH